ncbi:PTS glucose/sucrose transporter subunit IIB [Streptomyces sp. NPDC046862]|uniref:PTS glucose/sucrose transporter subunit IIB n=2 Tax=unclassified Streptomyces TaxID=2593676 RepID=UPI0034533519
MDALRSVVVFGGRKVVRIAANRPSRGVGWRSRSPTRRSRPRLRPLLGPALLALLSPARLLGAEHLSAFPQVTGTAWRATVPWCRPVGEGLRCDEAARIREKDMATKAEKIVAGLGGIDNIEEVEGCITRLRTEVADAGLVDEAALKAAGAHGVVKMGTAIQVVIGTDADPIAAEIEDMM